jgi:hypothetical protein
MKEDEMGRTCSMCGEEENIYIYIQDFSGMPEGNISPGRSSHRWEENIKMDLREDGVVSTGLIWLRIGVSGWL